MVVVVESYASMASLLIVPGLVMKPMILIIAGSRKYASIHCASSESQMPTMQLEDACAQAAGAAY